ncbi:hypothetical protein J2S74_000810 [Evansella vedderi]|uniref:FG-GAP repeat n=1 Tax=Evansella vedderi TaxID=38282 RepID=A0ABT9ZQC1_9BACI|nr:VCBS repeat-containing protein [Evansella vedderi]MDQ0253438.1 hypothetical protein [Evansella vedderi]
MKKRMLFTLFTIALIYFSPMTSHADDDLLEIIREFVPVEGTLVSPVAPANTDAYQLYDFDGDGKEEILVTYVLEAKIFPSPSRYGAMVLKRDEDGWKKIWETLFQGVGLDYSGFADITGDGTDEYLFGVTIGASAGNSLEIFQWKNKSLKEIGKVPYHMLELLPGKTIGLALWQRYIADTHFVEVLSWNGKKLVYDEELYEAYYPKIEAFYNEKLAQMDAWFYWYTLADAQVKANQFQKAKKSIEKGMALVKELSMPDEVKNFKKLRKQLEKKKKSKKIN